MQRSTPRHLAAALALATAALFIAQSTAHAAPLAAAFAPTSDVHGTRLQLNGSGTRFKAIFKIYDMALYTTRKVSTPEEVLALPGPKKLQFVALRELSTTDLGRLFVKGMSENATREQNTRHMTSSMRLIEIFS
ncbi:MAG: chalcone isomerase family protein, partial [Rhizobacter sp.]